MTWITIAWPMMASACLTLALMQLFAWIRQKEQWGYLFFAMAATAVAVIVAMELIAMRATTVEQMGTLLRWAHVPLLVFWVAIVGFVRFHFHAGRPGLAWAACGLRALALVLSFTTGENLFFREVTGLKQAAITGGETISIAQGALNPWYVVGPLSVLALAVFLVDASVAVWRRGTSTERRRALALGVSIAFFLVTATGHGVLVNAGVIESPYLVGVAFMPIVVVMAYELSSGVFRAAQLAGQLQASEAALRESEERMDLAANAAELGLWVWDIGRDRVWTTDKGRTLFGFPESEQIGLNRFLAALHPDDREAVRQGVTTCLNGNGDFESEYRVLLPDRQVRWIAARGRVEFDQRGKPVRMRGVALDITRRKEVELEALRQRNELAHLSRVTMLGELSGSLAHELNQPLTAILSNAQAAQRFLARDTPDLDELREILQDIVSDDKRAGEVIQRLRGLLRKEEVRHQPLDVNEVVHEVLKLVRSDLSNRNVTVTTQLEPGLHAVTGDRVQLQQVLLNLVINGCDAMANANGNDRQLVLRTGLTEGESVEVTVADRGSGIPNDEMERVFEPFFTSKPHGMGLGLAVCRTIIETHGGRLWATNNPDGGASFHFTLPATPRGDA